MSDSCARKAIELLGFGSAAIRTIASGDDYRMNVDALEAGLVLVRDAEAMRSAFSLVPPYIRQSGSAGDVYGLPWFSEYGFQQTRGFRALKVWMTMQQFGMKGYTAAIEENIALARHAS